MLNVILFLLQSCYHNNLYLEKAEVIRDKSRTRGLKLQLFTEGNSATRVLLEPKKQSLSKKVEISDVVHNVDYWLIVMEEQSLRLKWKAWRTVWIILNAAHTPVISQCKSAETLIGLWKLVVGNDTFAHFIIMLLYFT